MNIIIISRITSKSLNFFQFKESIIVSHKMIIIYKTYYCKYDEPLKKKVYKQIQRAFSHARIHAHVHRERKSKPINAIKETTQQGSAKKTTRLKITQIKQSIMLTRYMLAFFEHTQTLWKSKLITQSRKAWLQNTEKTTK